MKLFKWLATNGLFLFCLFAAIYWESEGAENIFAFVTILYFVVAVIVFFNEESQTAMKKILREQSAYYEYMSNTYYALMILPLLYVGWLWLAGAQIFMWIVVAGIRTNVQNENS